jgi:hypothetical protein
MTITILKWVIILSATINFGFMAFDGARALIVGDYIRPRSGPHAGQLGPWNKMVRFVGIDPESTLMKVLFILWGVTGLTMAFSFALGLDWAWKGLLAVSISALWYLIPGTGLNTLQIILLIILKFLK